MTLFGQYLDVIVASILIVRLFRLNLHVRYTAFLVFIGYDAFESIAFLGFKSSHLNIDYRFFYCATLLLTSVTTIWTVYALLILILKRLPGVLRFSLSLLNAVFGISILVGLLTIRPEFEVAAGTVHRNWISHTTVVVEVLVRALSFAELLSILLILSFVMFFPVRVPRNLASFSIGLSLYLVLSIGLELMRSYLPGFYSSTFAKAVPAYVISMCVVYWIFSINQAGEVIDTTVGRYWQSVPQDHLVRQLEAMNAALLRSRENS